MGVLGTSERVMERWATKAWVRLLPSRHARGEALAVLLRQCDDNTVIVGRRNVVVPNAFVVELLPDIHQLVSASPLPVAAALACEVRRHAAQRGYTWPGHGRAAPRTR
ncbi:FhaA domain-containing protein [Streptomyces sp. NPDC058807]|uniref:FhaA domain-containing protein n=1 Tax=unclassified Streptomyces TaxID=2593676 RepID=UPI00367812BF